MTRKSLAIISLLIGIWLDVSTAFASESSTYDFGWLDPDKEVFVLQNRKFRKSGKLHASAGAGFTTSGSFVDSKAFQGRIGYFVKEEWGVEVLYTKLSGKEDDTAASVRNNGAGTGSVPFRRIVKDYMGGMVIWSPFYSKVNTFNTIMYFDWVLGAGFAKVTEENNRDEFVNGPAGNKAKEENHTGPMWGTGLRFYLTELIDVRMDLTGIHYQAPKAAANATGKGWNEHYDLTLALGLRF